MCLWVAGFAYTLFSMVIYLGYSAVFPYTGGELVYIDEMFSEGTESRPRTNTGESQRSNNLSAPQKKRTIYTKVFGDGLLAYTVYAVLFCALFNSSTNALQVGRETLVALRPEESSPQMDVLRLIAVVALSILCLIQYWSSHAGRKINRWIAVIKLLFLVAVLIAGAVRTQFSPFEGHGFVECAPVQHSAVEAAKAMLLVIFSFEGWENATFVAGEIAPDNQGALRWVFMYAVTVVGCLYMAIVAVFMYAVPYTPVTVQFAPMLFGNSKAAYQAWAVLIAISALGSMNSIIYTFSRIKQCIGLGNIFPWSYFWASDSPDLKDHRNFDEDKSPKGGLWLHWIMSVVLIAVSAGVHSPLESIGMPGLIQTYTHCLILVFIAFGAFRLPSRAKDLRPTTERTTNSLDWKISRADWGWPLYILVTVYLLANLMVVIVTAIPPYVSQDGIPGSELASDGWSASDYNKTLTCTASHHSTIIKFGVPITPGKVSALRGWVLLCASLGTLVIGTAYYFGLLCSRTRRITIARIAGVAPEIDRPARYDFTKVRVSRFGSRRTIEYYPVVG
jgi:amino acid transporter